MPTERQMNQEGTIVSPFDVAAERLEDPTLGGVTTLPIGLRVERREGPLPGVNYSPPMRDHRKPRSYKFASAEQRAKCERLAADAGMSLTDWIEAQP